MGYLSNRLFSTKFVIQIQSNRVKCYLRTYMYLQTNNTVVPPLMTGVTTKTLAIFFSVEYLNCHCAHNSTLMTLQCLQSNVSHLFCGLSKKLLACSMQHLLILSLNFNLIETHHYNLIQQTFYSIK